jgi:hypothetical protein
MRALDVDMSDRYFPLRYMGATPVKIGHMSHQFVPQIASQSPGSDANMLNQHNSVYMSPLFSPPRQRRRLN